MAKTESKSAREARQQSTATAVEDPPAAQTQPEPPPAPPKRRAGPGRPPNGTPSPQNRGVFHRMTEIPTADWGLRAFIYLYRMEPFTDRLRSGNVVHIKKYHDPIDEERVMQEEGSGKYRAILNYRKPGNDRDSELERVEFEILNMNHPPNVPAGEWVDDPRNKKWAWAKKLIEEREAAKHAPPPAPAAGGDIVETLRVFNEIQGAAEDRAASKASGQPSMLEMIKAVKEVMPAPAPAQAENALLATIVTLMTEQTKAAQAEARELRAEIRDMRNQPAQGSQNGLGNLKDVVNTVKELLPSLKEVFPGAADKVDGIIAGGRSRMSGGQEFALEALRAMAPTLAPAIPFFLQRMFSPGALTPAAGQRGPLPGPPSQLPAAPGSPGGPVAPPQPEHPLIPFLQAVSQPLVRYVEKYAAGSDEHSGEDFYDTLMEMYGPTYNDHDWHAEAKAAGVVQLMMLYQSSSYWQKLAPIEPKFAEFLTAFINAGPVEIEAEQTGEQPEKGDF